MTAGALSHLKVLDLSWILAGPWAGQLLADLGAETIKVERPGTGDDTRSWGPPFVEGPDGQAHDAAYFLCANRNKKSLAIDFTRPEGQALVRALVKQCDVLIENFKVGGLAVYGLDYESLRQVNPRLIYCSITGFGQTGPYAARPGYDFLIQAMGGLMSITGPSPGEPPGGPQKVGVAVADILTGLYGTVGILAALAHRERTGEGQHIDVALLDVQVAALANQSSNYLVSGNAPGRMGNAHPNIVPYQDFPTADGYMIVAVGNDGQFARLCAAAGCAGLALDARFATNPDRVAHRVQLAAELSARTVSRTTADWVALLEAAGVPCGPINTLAEVFEDPQVRARGMQIDMPHSAGGTVPLVANPLRLSSTPPQYTTAPPQLGEHTRQVLSSLLHMADSDIHQLAEAGVIQTH
ncbi:CoA transferase [Polaromonas sp. P1(28)-13]|nr:CoA transferase [Polaromonas sp. P1(28)-13]